MDDRQIVDYHFFHLVFLAAEFLGKVFHNGRSVTILVEGLAGLDEFFCIDIIYGFKFYLLVVGVVRNDFIVASLSPLGILVVATGWRYALVEVGRDCF